jgi:hypothetical protein
LGLADAFADGAGRGASPPAAGAGAAAQALGIGGIPAIPAAKTWAIARDAVASHSGSAAIPANWSCHNSR